MMKKIVCDLKEVTNNFVENNTEQFLNEGHDDVDFCGSCDLF